MSSDHQIDATELRNLTSLCDDATRHASRLTKSEVNFILALWDNIEKLDINLRVTPGQWKIIDTIEAKVYNK